VAYTGTSSNTAPKSTSGAGSTTTGAAPASTSKPNPWYPDHAVVSASKDQLKSMTEFKYTAD